MHQLLDAMNSLKPFFISEKRMTDPKNEAEIKQSLKKLSEAAKDLHDPRFNSPTLKVSKEILQAHIFETERMFNSGGKAYSRWMLESTLTVCMSCHSQVPSLSKSFEGFFSPQVFTAPFEQAEFYFAIRNFDKAHEIYDSVIRKYPSNGIENMTLEDAAERQATYFARIKRDPSAAKVYFESVSKNEAIPPFLKKNIQAWIRLFDEWSREGTPSIKTISESEFRSYISKSMAVDPKRDDFETSKTITYLKVSGLLYEYLDLHPKTTLKPEILYWLAQCDRNLEHNFFFSLSDMYLRECILKFPESPIAEKCFEDYQQSTIAGYSGSAGVFVPDEVNADLQKLRKLILKKKKRGI